MKNRFLNAYGAPAHAGFLRTSFHNAQLRLSILTTAFASAAMAATDQMSAIPLIVQAGMILPLMMAMIERRNVRTDLIRTRTDPDKLCIDRKPDAWSKPTSPDNMERARRLTGLAALRCFFCASLLPFVMDAKTQNMLLPGTMAQNILLLNIFGGAALAYGLHARRYGNVIREKWTILEMPPRKKEDKSLSLNPYAKPAM